MFQKKYYNLKYYNLKINKLFRKIVLNVNTTCIKYGEMKLHSIYYYCSLLSD